MTDGPPFPPAEHTPAIEHRDTERAIALWRHKASEYGGLPPATAFDFSRMLSDWGYRFVICSDRATGEHTFPIYGSQFARLFDLPETPESGVPLARQLPARYLSLFIEGCGDAIAQGEPVRMNGLVVHQGKIEFHRTVFMPLAPQPHSPAQLVLGSFNRRPVVQATSGASTSEAHLPTLSRIRSLQTARRSAT